MTVKLWSCALKPLVSLAEKKKYINVYCKNLFNVLVCILQTGVFKHIWQLLEHSKLSYTLPINTT